MPSQADYDILVERIEYLESVVDKLQRPPPAPSHRIMSPREVALYVKVRKSRVYEAIEDGSLKWIASGPARFGRTSYLIAETDAAEWGRSLRKRN